MVKPSARTIKFSALQVAYVAVCAATVTAGKMALSAIPNVEVVSLLLAAYGYTFGWMGVMSSFVFCAVEMLIWGINSWVILYFIYWPALTVLFAILSKLKIKNRLILTLAACVMTVFFGVLSSLIDTGLFTGFYSDFFARFAIIYARGAAFYITQIACNAILFPILFSPLVKLLSRLTPARLLHYKKHKKTYGRGEKLRENLNCDIL